MRTRDFDGRQFPVLFSPVSDIEEVVFSSREGMLFVVFKLKHARGKDDGNDHVKGIGGRDGL